MMPHSLVLVPASIRPCVQRRRGRLPTMIGMGGSPLTRSVRRYRLYCDSVAKQVKPPSSWTYGLRRLFAADRGGPAIVSRYRAGPAAPRDTTVLPRGPIAHGVGTRRSVSPG